MDWACNRDSSLSHDKKLVAGSRDFSGALTAWEARQLKALTHAAGGGEDGATWVVSLWQDVDFKVVSNQGKRTLHTLTKQNFPMYSLKSKRWLTPTEALATNMLVVTPALSQFGEMSSFCFDRSDYGMPPRSRSAMFFQAGDSMSLPCVGVALLWYHCHNKRIEIVVPRSFLGTVSAALKRQSSDASGSEPAVSAALKRQSSEASGNEPPPKRR